MTHPAEERLLALGLEIVEDEAERRALAGHLAECQQCRERLGEIAAGIELLREFTVPPLKRSYPVPRRMWRQRGGVWRAAASFVALAVGGYLAWHAWLGPVGVEPMALNFRSLPDSVATALAAAPDVLRVREGK